MPSGPTNRLSGLRRACEFDFQGLESLAQVADLLGIKLDCDDVLVGHYGLGLIRLGLCAFTVKGHWRLCRNQATRAGPKIAT